MDFIDLLIGFLSAYTLGVFAGPYIGRYFKRDRMSIPGGIASVLGGLTPYLLLHSVWMRDWRAENIGRTAELLISTAGSLLAITVVELLLRRMRWVQDLDRRIEINSRTASHAPRGSVWLWCCAPALLYVLWEHSVGTPNVGEWLRDGVGLSAFVGVTGMLLSLALRGPRPR